MSASGSGLTQSRPLVIVTGGARRVGRAIVRAFAASGCDLLLTYRESNREAATTREELTRMGAAVRLERLDLSDLPAVESWGARVARELPRVDVLVHNASIYGPTPLGALTAEQMLSHYRVNAASPLLLSRQFATRLAESPLPGGGAIVAMADMHVLGRPRKDFAAYAMSKAALVEMVRTLARALAPRVRVNAVAPGVVAFPGQGYESDPEAQRAYIERVPLKRSGTPEDAADVVRWLALDAHYVTGEVVRVDGGRWLA